MGRRRSRYAIRFRQRHTYCKYTFLLSRSHFLPESSPGVSRNAVILATFPGVWFLCLATAWGLKRNRAWARRTGVAACLCLLPVFPWFTALGVVGLVAILSLRQGKTLPALVPSVSGAVPDNYWILKSESFAQVVFAFLLMNVVIVAVPRSGWASFGSVREWPWFLSAVVLFLFNVTVHEIGHASVALLLSHRVHAICIGPCTFSKGSDGYGVQLQPKRLLAFGGYMGSVPIHCRHLRLRQIAIVAAGRLRQCWVAYVSLP